MRPSIIAIPSLFQSILAAPLVSSGLDLNLRDNVLNTPLIELPSFKTTKLEKDPGNPDTGGGTVRDDPPPWVYDDK